MTARRGRCWVGVVLRCGKGRSGAEVSMFIAGTPLPWEQGLAGSSGGSSAWQSVAHRARLRASILRMHLAALLARWTSSESTAALITASAAALSCSPKHQLA